MSELSQVERTAIHKIVGTDARGAHLLAEEVWLAARDYGRERERALEDVLTVIAGEYGCGLIEPPDQSLPPEGDPCHERYPDDPEKWCVSCIASMALWGLGASPGEPEGQPSRIITKPDEFPRFLECPGCGLKRLFSPYEGRCDECRSQPDHGPGEPSETDRLRKAIQLCLDERSTEWAVDPADMDQRFVAQEYARKLERIYARLSAVLVGESNG
jgi:hypothetical protein